MKKNFTLHPQLMSDCIELVKLPISTLLLCNDCAYPWFILVPRIDNAKDLYQLEWQEQQQILNESSLLGEILMQEFQGDKLNVAMLGNVVSQLHLHHVVRFKYDACWPKPIWGQQPLTPYDDDEIQALKQRIVPKILAVISDELAYS